MSDHAKAMVWASFIGDALCLGPHWEYDPQVLLDRFGPVTGYLDPPLGSYHAGKKAGNQTHYGDQTLVLLESVAARGSFDLTDFATRWQALFRDYRGYVDGATRLTLRRFEAGAGPDDSGSNSNDLAGASRVAPLIFALAADPATLDAAALAQTRLTHNHAQVLEAAVFFARTARLVLEGAAPCEALRAAARIGEPSDALARWLEAGLASVGTETGTAIGVFGRSCHIGEAMPGVIHLLARHEGDLAGCLRDNAMAGGDSAARGMLCGMILGAAQGLSAIPEAWLSGLAAGPVIAEHLATLAG